MTKVLLAAAVWAIAAPAFAEESGLSLSGNVALTSNYVFRGLTYTDNNPAIQGGFDAAYGTFYAGTWASNTKYNADDTIELDLYAGVKPTLGPVSMDIGIVSYFYPDADDRAIPGDYDAFEAYAKGYVKPIEPLTLGAMVYYSPEFSLDGGDAWYLEGNAAYAFSGAVSVSGAFGYQSVENYDYSLASPLSQDDSYLNWNIGTTYSFSGFSLDVRYSDTDVKRIDDPTDTYKSRVVVAIKRAL